MSVTVPSTPAPTRRHAVPALVKLPRMQRGPLFGGYGLVAAVVAWLVGIAARSQTALAMVEPLVWLVVGMVAGGVWIGAWLARRRLLRPHAGVVGRVLLVSGLLICWAALGAARAAYVDASSDPHAVSRLLPEHVNGALRVRGTVAAEPNLREGFQLLTVEVTATSLDGGRSWQQAVGRMEATVRSLDDWSAPAYGDSITLAGTLAPMDSGYVPPGVLARLKSARVVAHAAGNPLFAWLFGLRLRLAEAMQRSVPEPEAALLIGILLGMKTPTLRSRLPLFTATGTIHLVVPAGLKVVTLAELAKQAVRRVGPWARTGAALCAVTVYAALGGGGPAAIRAALMGGLLALAPALGRGYNVFTALALAAIGLSAVEPLVIFDAGFQLTMLATLGLPLLTPVIQRRLARGIGWLPGGGAIAELLAVTIAAQVATLPVLALTFHEVSLVAPLANLLAVPLLAPLLVLGGLVALMGVIGGVTGAVALAVAWVAWPLLWFVDGVIAMCAVLPAAALVVPDLSPFVAWGYYVALAGAFWWAMRVARRGSEVAGTASGAAVVPVVKVGHGTSGHVQLPRGVLTGVLVVALLGACGAAAPPLTDRMAHVDFMAVGLGGEATLVRLSSGVTVLIDGGPSGPALETQLSGKLPFWRRGLDLALLTDPRAGDANGLLDVGTHFAVAHAADAGMLHPSATYLAWRDAMRRAGAEQAQVREGDVIHLDGQSAIRVLAPPRELYPADEGGTTASNDAIVRLELPGLRVLLLGAADDYALDALAYANEPLEADVVEVALPPDAPLTLEGPLGVVLAKAHPHLIVVASAPLSPNSTRARLAADANYEALDTETAGTVGALLYRTDVAGTITLSGDAGGWVVG